MVFSRWCGVLLTPGPGIPLMSGLGVLLTPWPGAPLMSHHGVLVTPGPGVPLMSGHDAPFGLSMTFQGHLVLVFL